MLTHVFNLSLSSGVFPETWKQAKVVPLLKRDCPMTPSNFRPVSQLSPMSRALEKIAFLQLMKYLTDNRLLHPNHHGGRPGHNTATALVQMVDQWAEEVERGKIVGLMMTDQSSAYDMVSFSIMKSKLALFGLSGRALEWVDSFMRGRTQVTCVDGKVSLALELEQGVTQGSSLSPLLYISS